MQGFYTVVKYFPDINREEGFGVGLILTNSKTSESFVKFSKERIRRINSAFDIVKSKLIELLITELEKKNFTQEYIDYLSKYENGTIRYTSPKIIVAEDFKHKFDELYLRLIADYKELNFESRLTNKTIRLGSSFRKILISDSCINEKLNIDYRFKDNELNTLLFKNTNIDFIGGNGSIFCGEIIDLANEEDSIKRNFYKTITLFEAIEKTYQKIKRFNPKDCKILIRKDQADMEENTEYMTILEGWSKNANYDLLIEKDLEKFVEKIRKQIIDKNIISFEDWSKKFKQEISFHE
jgi:hypothetical protein